MQSAQQGEAQAAAQAELQAAFQSWQAWVAEGGDSDPSTYVSCAWALSVTGRAMCTVGPQLQ